MLKKILPFVLFIALFGTFYLAFQKQNAFEGSFNTDEPGIVIGSFSPHGSLNEILNDTAAYAQPPLDLFIREKIYFPLGNWLGITKAYPEFFHRFLSLLWWLLPIGYFFLNLKDFSKKRKLVIGLAFLLIISSEFMQYYLAEARHYSAIAASFLLMIIILFSDKVSMKKLKYKFLLSSLLPPLLHIISFPYYFILVLFFFYRLSKESINKRLSALIYPITFYLIYFALFITLYFYISKISYPSWQHPNIMNIHLDFINSYIKWTIDWIFYKTPFQIIYEGIPSLIKNNLLLIFGLCSILSIVKLAKLCFFNTQKQIDVTTFFPIMIFLIWPLTIVAVTYRSNLFSGERYSIAILIVLLFYLSKKIIDVAYFVKNLKSRLIIIAVVFIISASFLYPSIITAQLLPSKTDENIFFIQNKYLLSNRNNIIILDNGIYANGIPLYALIYNFEINAELDYCHAPTLFTEGKNNLNGWIKDHQKGNIYLLTTGKVLIGFNPIWQHGSVKLYKINKEIDSSNLCPDQDSQVGECYLRCTKGNPPSADGRSIPGTAPHIDVYR